MVATPPELDLIGPFGRANALAAHRAVTRTGHFGDAALTPTAADFLNVEDALRAGSDQLIGVRTLKGVDDLNDGQQPV
jgi:hypothetical protein